MVLSMWLLVLLVLGLAAQRKRKQAWLLAFCPNFPFVGPRGEQKIGRRSRSDPGEVKAQGGVRSSVLLKTLLRQEVGLLHPVFSSLVLLPRIPDLPRGPLQDPCMHPFIFILQALLFAARAPLPAGWLQQGTEPAVAELPCAQLPR